MGENERLIGAYPVFIDRLVESGFDGVAILRDDWTAAVALASLGAVLGSNNRAVRVLAAILFVATVVDLLLWVCGLGSIVEFFTG